MFEKYQLDDLKTVYGTLSRSIAERPELLDSDFLQDLQTYLQKVASEKGYDVSLHADWENFLKGAGPLESV